MEFEEMQNKITDIFLTNLKRDKIDIDIDYLMLKITEELGEFIQSYLIHQKKCRPEKYRTSECTKREMAKELSDVIGLVFVISKKLDVDLEEALTKKWITREWINSKHSD